MQRISIFMTLLIALMLAALASVAMAFELNTTIDQLVAEQQKIRQDVQAATGRFADMPLVKRVEITRQQDKLFALLDRKTSISELNPKQENEVSNILLSINAAIENTGDERIVCERIKKTGSHAVTRVCRSVAQIKADREAARTQLQSPQGMCNYSACSSKD